MNIPGPAVVVVAEIKEENKLYIVEIQGDVSSISAAIYASEKCCWIDYVKSASYVTP